MVLPLLWAGAAAAAFLAGCATQKNTTQAPQAPPTGPKGPEPKPAFGNDNQARSLFEKLKSRRGRMDLGCPTLIFSQDGRWKRILEGKGDLKISSCELYEYLLNHQESFPALIPTLTGRPVPWDLNETNPPSELQPYLEKINRAIEFLDHLLRAKGLKPGAPDYGERMAIGLFYFVSVPNIEKQQEQARAVEELRLKKDKSESETRRLQSMEKAQGTMGRYLNALDRELSRLDLNEFKEFHRVQGGLYLQGDLSKEYSAQEALIRQYGECTEKSKILYALLRKVGLDASFIFVNPRSSQEPILKELWDINRNLFHVALELKLPGRTVVLDPALLRINPAHGSHILLSLREFLSLDFLGRANNFSHGKDPELELTFLNKALSLDAHSYLAYANRGTHWKREGFRLALSGDLEGAVKSFHWGLEDYNRSIQANPSLPFAYDGRAGIWLGLKKWEKALVDLNQALQLDPDFYFSYRNRGILFLMTDHREKAAADFSRFLRLNPENGPNILFEDLKAFFESLSPDASVRAQFEADTGLDFAGAQAQQAVSQMLWNAQQHPLAREYLKTIYGQLIERKSELKKSGQDFSPIARQFIEVTFEDLPPGMQADPSVSQWKSDLQAGEPSPSIRRAPLHP